MNRPQRNEPQLQVFEHPTRYMPTNCITTDSQVAIGCIGNIFDALRVFFTPMKI